MPSGEAVNRTSPFNFTHAISLVTPDTDKDSGKKQYAYDPHLDPTLQWAGKAEHTSFEVPTVSLHVHERIDPATILAAVQKRIKDSKGKTMGGFQPDMFHAPFENLPLSQAGKKFQEEVNTLLAEADAAGVDPQKIAAARAAFESRNQTEIENQVLERQVALRDRIKTLDERIAEIRERMLNKQVLSRQVTTDSFIGGLQTNVLSINTNEDRERLKNLEAIKNEMLERQKLIDNLNLLNRAYSEAGDPEALKRLALRPANRFAIEPIGAFKGQDYGAVLVQNALRQMIAEQQNNTKELIRKDTTPRAQ